MTASKAALSLVLLASLLALVPTAAGAQQQGGLEVELPPNTDCRGAAVIVKATVTEDAAAANMPAEALRVLPPGGAERCLLDADLPSQGRAPDTVFRSSFRLSIGQSGSATVSNQCFIKLASVARWASNWLK